MGAEPGGIEMNKNYDPQVKAIQEYFDNAFAYLGSKNAEKGYSLRNMKGLQTGEKSLYVNANGEKEIIDAVLFKKKNNIKKHGYCWWLLHLKWRIY